MDNLVLSIKHFIIRRTNMDKYKIYPKQYRTENISVQKNKCFVLMQFSEDLDIVYGTIKKELDNIGFICNRADDISGSPIIFNKILTEMFSSRFIIAELTHNNPNVFYELGIAHSFKESTNIILIKQKSEQNIAYPFDLKHLQYIEYTPDNLKLLTAQIKNCICANKYLSDFYEILNIKGIIPFISDNQDDFVEYLSAELGEKSIIIITEILNSENLEIAPEEIDIVFNHYENLIKKTLVNNRMDVLEGVLKIYFELIYNCNYIQITEVFTTRFIKDQFNLPDEISWKIQLLSKLVLGKKMLNICMPWIVEYFSKLRATNIDLNRYKLERLLLTCNYEEVNECIIDAVYSPDCHIRESMVDIIGEKHLQKALNTLYNRLEVEENVYVSRSIVEAIGKIDNIQGIETLLNWFKNNVNKFETAKYYGIYNHMVYALQRMDTSLEKQFLCDFVRKYRNRITIPGIE